MCGKIFIEKFIANIFEIRDLILWNKVFKYLKKVSAATNFDIGRKKIQNLLALRKFLSGKIGIKNSALQTLEEYRFEII